MQLELRTYSKAEGDSYRKGVSSVIIGGVVQ